MGMSKHTPGPWEVRRYAAAGGTGWELVGDTSAGPDEVYLGELEDRPADARLIAAAPDLLSLVERMRSAVWNAQYGADISIGYARSIDGEVHALLARIEGE